MEKDHEINWLVLNHPYIQYVAKLNWTECYKIKLLAGDSTIERFIPHEDLETYFKLRKEFVDKYPSIVLEWKNLQPSDCVIF